jgi:methionyl-tRNA synthetase
MTRRYRDGRLTSPYRNRLAPLDSVDAEHKMEIVTRGGRLESASFTLPSLHLEANEAVDLVIYHIDDHDISDALASIRLLAFACNHMIEMVAPWELAKDSEANELLDEVLYQLGESLRIIAILISPLLPKAAHGIFDQLNWRMEKELSGKEERFSLEDAQWGGLPDGHVVGKPVPLFPRIEISD